MPRAVSAANGAPENSKTTKRELIHCFQRSTRIEADKRERGGKGRPYCDDGQSTA